MITLSDSSKHNTRANETAQKPIETIETAGSLAMLFQDGLLTVGQYDEFITNNPFAVDFSLYSNFIGDDSGESGFLSNFSNAVATIQSGASSTGFSTAGFSSGCSGGSCGSFTSVC